ncbi:hypothetical protein MUY35_13090 [Aliiroseovarius sp. S1339]|uniref:DUF6639 family protein n=1 Tax=Aliiroseovarius sp. S1339 TaxID=2936990 RepID=UPI0020BF1E08|nr:DUF6639 family protein [Aliiroseovarius sp. S1339]MCK8464786.1 hypothetical protein [Aliiroseovarius sp. S1339]
MQSSKAGSNWYLNKRRCIMRNCRILILRFILAFLFAQPAAAETTLCKNVNVAVSANDKKIVETVCDTAHRAARLFSQCHLPALAETIQIDVVSVLPDGCNAQYHCGKNRIEVLSPEIMRRHRNKDGAFGFLTDDAFYQSVIVHELTHASFDKVPCPFNTCIVTDEYVAYAMQIMSLSVDAQEVFRAKSDLDHQVSRDELSEILLFLSPDRFAQKTWAHLSQRPDACAFIHKLTGGAVYLDHERFDIAE